MAEDFTQDLYNQLIETADQMRDLAQSLSPKGRTLNKKESELARLAMSTKVNALFDDARMSFLTGDKEDMVKAMDQAYEIASLIESIRE